MSHIEDALDCCIDAHTLLREDAVGEVKSASIAVNTLLIDCLSRMSEKKKQKYEVFIDYQDAYLILSALFVAISKTKNFDHVCIDSLRHTMSCFLEKVPADD
jgi:hypothetical protein